MKRLICVMLCVSLGMVLCGTALASPAINSAVIQTRIWNDNPTSIVTTTNSYPSSITINDDQRGSDGGNWANLHIVRLSTDGTTPASFANGDAFGFAADVTITGTGNAEAGLQVAPWWSLQGDGKFMINGQTGEIAAFGGRLPFYSFTTNYSLTYTKGDTVRMGVVYRPNSLSALDPATIEYIVTMGLTTYSSGQLAFDEGNPAEDPPHGLYGMLSPAQVGGYFQPQVWDTTVWEQATFGNMVYVPEPATMMILGLGSLFLARRRK
ncbi:MAG: PEP-CTERM sorting domain-containing protein [Sedimentisphaerales bacterium]